MRSSAGTPHGTGMTNHKGQARMVYAAASCAVHVVLDGQTLLLADCVQLEPTGVNESKCVSAATLKPT
jgi:hypothetical protein